MSKLNEWMTDTLIKVNYAQRQKGNSKFNVWPTQTETASLSSWFNMKLPAGSDVSPWPWYLRPKSKSLTWALALWLKSLGLGLDSVGRGPDAIMACFSPTSWSLWYGICAPWILVERILAVPASSAPVQRVFFSNSGCQWVDDQPTVFGINPWISHDNI